jgi:hypothetical protein
MRLDAIGGALPLIERMAYDVYRPFPGRRLTKSVLVVIPRRLGEDFDSEATLVAA